MDKNTTTLVVLDLLPCALDPLAILHAVLMSNFGGSHRIDSILTVAVDRTLVISYKNYTV